jgi:hypothetical protein
MGGVDAHRIYFVRQVLSHLNDGEGMLFSSRLLSHCGLRVFWPVMMMVGPQVRSGLHPNGAANVFAVIS